MKKSLLSLIVISFAMFIIISGTSFAQAPPAADGQDAFYGDVVSVDAATGQVQMTEMNSGTEKTFTADKEILDTLKAEDKVKLNLKKGTTVIESVERGPSQQQGNPPAQQQGNPPAQQQ